VAAPLLQSSRELQPAAPEQIPAVALLPGAEFLLPASPERDDRLGTSLPVSR